MYDEVALNCFRYFGFKSLDEVDRLTIKEYEMLCEAEGYKQVDRHKDIALGAWLSFLATAKKKAGKNLKPVYPTFKSFFDYEAELKKLKGGSSMDDLKQRYKDLQERLRNVSAHNRSDTNG